MSFASNQVARLETLLAQIPGVTGTVTVDGQTVTYGDLKKEYEFWKSRAARENGTRPRAAQVYLGGF